MAGVGQILEVVLKLCKLYVKHWYHHRQSELCLKR